MMWQLYALLSAVSIGFQRIINAYVVKTEDHLAYSWFATCLTSLFFMLLLIMMGDIALPTSLHAWALALIAGVLWTLITILGFKSYQLTPLSLRESLSRVDMLFLLFFSALLLGESITLVKVLGTGCIFIGLIVLTRQKEKAFGRLTDKGVQLTLLVAAFHGLVSVIDKRAVVFFLPAFYGFLEYALVPVYLMPVAVKNRDKIKQIIINKKFIPIIGSVLSVIAYYSRLQASILTEVSNVFPVLQLSTVISILGGFIFFKEGELRSRIIGSIIMIIGSILILNPELINAFIQ
ncbi:MAG: EamA family transporter [Candidatus Bathyarchaeota archaeon]|nr:MAG: EamA family transporter [Candidatus Bathyarchaeota archaeon]